MLLQRQTRNGKSFIDFGVDYMISRICRMTPNEERPQPDMEVQQASSFKSGLRSTAGTDDATALKAIFRILLFLCAYLLLIELVGVVAPLSPLTQELLRFVPYCVFLAVLAYLAWPVMKPNRPTLLLGLFLICVFFILLLGVTRRLPSLAQVAVIGPKGSSNRDLQTLLMLVALGCFLSGGYFMLEQIVLSRVRLKCQLEQLQQLKAVLAESEERFRTLVEQAPDGIYVQTEGHFAYLNATALRLFGADSAEQLLNRAVLERSPPEDRPAVAERIRSLDQERRVIPRVEQKFLRLDGSAFEVAVSMVPLVYKNGNSALIFFRDITERKRLEDQLRQAQKMEAVGQLAGGVAHDFNNMLTVIQVYCGLLLEETMHPSEMQEGLQQIAQAARRASDLTGQLLMFSRRKVVQMRALELNDVLRNLQAMLARLLGETIELEFRGRLDLPLIEADLGMVEQVVLNLSTNARDAMPRGGQLTISLDVVEIDAQAVQANPEAREGRFVCLVVSDTGCGMDEPTRKHVFEPFFTTKDVGKGTGLGLATVYGIVKQHKGWIDQGVRQFCWWKMKRA
jgi:PAS domain S-box-containing protein